METFSALLAIWAGNSPASGEFPAQRPVTLSFDIFFDLCLNKRLRKQLGGWWFETLSRPLYVIVMICFVIERVICSEAYILYTIDYRYMIQNDIVHTTHKSQLSTGLPILMPNKISN